MKGNGKTLRPPKATLEAKRRARRMGGADAQKKNDERIKPSPSTPGPGWGRVARKVLPRKFSGGKSGTPRTENENSSRN